MTTATETVSATGSGVLQLATFYLGDLLMGVDIQQVEEINRHLCLTPAPQAPECVRGVVNLRGDVVTVVDLRVILGMEPTEITGGHRNVVVHSQEERIGLLVDRIADVVNANVNEVEPPPANVSGVDGRFFKGIYKLDTELLVIVDVDEVLSSDSEARYAKKTN